MTDFPVKDHIINQEMMSHPAIFMHPHPKKIAILGDDDCGILQEVLRHENVNEVQHVSNKAARLIHYDERISLRAENINQWIQSSPKESFDILIIAQEATPENFESFYQLLNAEGFLIQQAQSPFDVVSLKKIQDQFTKAKFTDIHFMIYSQPQFPSGMRTALLVKKHGNFKRVREKDVFDRNFQTNYYNFDIHKASLVLPEFMRKELQTT